MPPHRAVVARAPIGAYFRPRMLDRWVQKLQTLLNGGSEALKRERKDPLGERGENLAAKELQKLGYKIYVRNFKCPLGEIDIVARDGKTLVFVEVKTRMADEPTPEEQINPEKMHQITKAAKQYLSRYGEPKPPARFDVVAIVWPNEKPPVIRHIQNAFEPTF